MHSSTVRKVGIKPKTAVRGSLQHELATNASVDGARQQYPDNRDCGTINGGRVQDTSQTGECYDAGQPVEEKEIWRSSVDTPFLHLLTYVPGKASVLVCKPCCKVLLQDVFIDTADEKGYRQAYVERCFPENNMHYIRFRDNGVYSFVVLTSENCIVLEKPQKVPEREISLPEHDHDASDIHHANSQGEGNTQAQIAPIANDKKGKQQEAEGQHDIQADSEETNDNASLVQTETTFRTGHPEISIASSSEHRTKRLCKASTRISKKTGGELCGCVLEINWPGDKILYEVLVVGYNPGTKHHLLVYLESGELEKTKGITSNTRSWSIIDDPTIEFGKQWIRPGKRIYGWWPVSYDDPSLHSQATELFEGEAHAPFEGYVLTNVEGGAFQAMYTATCRMQEFKIADINLKGVESVSKLWGFLEKNQTEVRGCPVVHWSRSANRSMVLRW